MPRDFGVTDPVYIQALDEMRKVKLDDATILEHISLINRLDSQIKEDIERVRQDDLIHFTL